MTPLVLDALARPRIAVVVDEGEPFLRALAARTLTLALLRRLPRTRVVVGATVVVGASVVVVVGSAVVVVGGGVYMVSVTVRVVRVDT